MLVFCCWLCCAACPSAFRHGLTGLPPFSNGEEENAVLIRNRVGTAPNSFAAHRVENGIRLPAFALFSRREHPRTFK